MTTSSTCDEFDAYLKAEYEGGKSISEISLTVCLSDESVRKRLHRAGTPLRPRGWTKESCDMNGSLRTDYENGRPLTELARERRCCANTISLRLRRAGVPPRTIQRSPPLVGVEADLLREQYESGRTVTELAQEHRCSSQKIRRCLKRAGVVLRPKPPDVDPERAVIPPRVRSKNPDVDPDFLRKEYESGKTLQTISLATGLTVGTVHKLLIQAGTTMRPSGRIAGGPTETNLAVRAAYDAGKTVAELAQERGISRQGVEHHLRRAGALSTDSRFKMPWDLNQSLRDEYEGGKTQQELALKWGCSSSTIGYRIQRAAGQPPKNRRKTAPQSDR